MPVGDQEHRGVAVAPAALLGRIPVNAARHLGGAGPYQAQLFVLVGATKPGFASTAIFSASQVIAV